MLIVENFDGEQGTEEWFAARSRIPTASMFSTVMAKGRGGGISKTRQKYLYQLAGERITGEPMETYTNGHMERGHVMEIEARDNYQFLTGNEVIQVGFVRNGQNGASPDGLVGDDGLLEIKSKLPHLQIHVLLEDRIPPEHIAQIQGQLWITEREWCDFVSYFTGMPIFIKRTERDEKYIANLAREVALFNEELNELEEKLRRMQ